MEETKGLLGFTLYTDCCETQLCTSCKQQDGWFAAPAAPAEKPTSEKGKGKQDYLAPSRILRPE